MRLMMRNLLIVSCVMLLTLFVLLSAAGCQADREGRIVFLSGGVMNDSDIYSMNPDGSDRVRLAPWYRSLMPYHSIWSAGGKTLAYIDSDNNTHRFWLAVVEGNGQNRRRLLDITDLKMDSMAMSPDGKTVILSLDSTRMKKIEALVDGTVHVETIEEEDTDLFTVDVKSGKLRRVTDTPDIKELSPSYSPDGKLIAFTGQIDTENIRDIPQDINVMNADGDNIRRLAHHNEGFPAGVAPPELIWSPDGTRIAYSYRLFVSGMGTRADIFLIDVKNGSLTNLTNSPNTMDAEPLWSPDGRRLVYYSDYPRSFMMNINDLSVTELYPTWHSWAPDGRLIFTNPMNVFELMIMDTDGKNQQTLAVSKDVRISMPFWLSE